MQGLDLILPLKQSYVFNGILVIPNDIKIVGTRHCI